MRALHGVLEVACGPEDIRGPQDTWGVTCAECHLHYLCREQSFLVNQGQTVRPHAQGLELLLPVSVLQDGA